VGSWEWEVGSGKLGVGSWEWEVGSGKLEVGSWKWEASFSYVCNIQMFIEIIDNLEFPKERGFAF